MCHAGWEMFARQDIKERWERKMFWGQQKKKRKEKKDRKGTVKKIIKVNKKTSK